MKLARHPRKSWKDLEARRWNFFGAARRSRAKKIATEQRKKRQKTIAIEIFSTLREYSRYRDSKKKFCESSGAYVKKFRRCAAW